MLHNLKMLIRSGSWDFMRSRKPGIENYRRKLYTYRWNTRPVYYRPGTSDRGLVYNILIQKGKKAEYYIDPAVKPEVILDIGANIGITAIWMARMFPAATIYCFEPVAENFEILKKNIEPYPNIEACQFGLGKSDCMLDIFPNSDSTNYGGFSVFNLDEDANNAGTSQTAATQVRIRDTNAVLKELHIERADIIKIDTEGAEYDILTTLPSELLGETQWLMGELHGIKNFETLLYLDKWFLLGMKKKLHSNLFQFFASNRNLE